MNRKIHKIKTLIGIAILTVFVFSFLHSELGFLNHEDENHDAEDLVEMAIGLPARCGGRRLSCGSRQSR